MDLCLDNSSNTQNIINSSCCHNIHLLIKGQTPVKKALQATNLEIQNLAIIVDFDSFNFKDAYQQQPSFNQNYIPPLLVKNIPVLVQTFRI